MKPFYVCKTCFAAALERDARHNPIVKSPRLTVDGIQGGDMHFCKDHYQPAFFADDLLKEIADRKAKYASDDSPALIRHELQSLADTIKGPK